MPRHVVGEPGEAQGGIAHLDRIADVPELHRPARGLAGGVRARVRRREHPGEVALDLVVPPGAVGVGLGPGVDAAQAVRAEPAEGARAFGEVEIIVRLHEVVGHLGVGALGDVTSVDEGTEEVGVGAPVGQLLVDIDLDLVGLGDDREVLVPALLFALHRGRDVQALRQSLLEGDVEPADLLPAPVSRQRAEFDGIVGEDALAGDLRVGRETRVVLAGGTGPRELARGGARGAGDRPGAEDRDDIAQQVRPVAVAAVDERGAEGIGVERAADQPEVDGRAIGEGERGGGRVAGRDGRVPVESLGDLGGGKLGRVAVVGLEPLGNIVLRRAEVGPAAEVLHALGRGAQDSVAEGPVRRGEETPAVAGERRLHPVPLVVVKSHGTNRETPREQHLVVIEERAMGAELVELCLDRRGPARQPRNLRGGVEQARGGGEAEEHRVGPAEEFHPLHVVAVG